MSGGSQPHPESLYYHIAGDSLASAENETDRFRKMQYIATSLVFSALCLEIFINDAFHQQAMTNSALTDFERLPLKEKWLLLPLISGASKTFDIGSEPFQTFSALIKLRNNRLVHFKPRDEIDTGEKPLKKRNLNEIFCDMGLAKKHYENIAMMIAELNRLTNGKTALPGFLTGSKYIASVWKTLTLLSSSENEPT